MGTFPFVFQTRTTSFTNLSDHLQEQFVVEGTPDGIVSDNGPPFCHGVNKDKEFGLWLSVVYYQLPLYKCMCWCLLLNCPGGRKWLLVYCGLSGLDIGV